MSFTGPPEAPKPELSTPDSWRPEAFIRVVGLQSCSSHLRANLVCIGRAERDEKDKVQLEDERGRSLTTKQQMRTVADEWEAHNSQGDDRRMGAVSRSIVLSSPRGSHPEKVLEAAREWAHKELGDRRWVMALHTDTPYPHVHITYAIRDNNRVRYYPRPGYLHPERKAWARELNAQGIAVVATTVPDRIIARQRRVSAKVER